MVFAGCAAAQTLFLQDGHFPSWSPDGSSIICNRIQGATEDSDIFAWTVGSSGGEVDTLLADPSGVWYPQWLPDGERIVYHRTRRDSISTVYEFVVRDPRGSTAVVWSVPAFWHDAAFRLSSDGALVIYTTLQGGRTLWTLDVASGATAALRPGTDGHISPDGQWIAFTIDGSVAVAPVSGGAERRIEPGSSPCWTPDGRSIVFTGAGAHGYVDLILLNIEDGSRKQLTDDAAMDLRSSVSPDGHTVAFVKTLDDDYGPFDLWLVDLESTAARSVSWSGIKSVFR